MKVEQYILLRGLSVTLGLSWSVHCLGKRCPPISGCQALGQNPPAPPGQGGLLKRILVLLFSHDRLVSAASSLYPQ